MIIFLTLNASLTAFLGVIWERPNFQNAALKMVLLALSCTSIIFLLIELGYLMRIPT